MGEYLRQDAWGRGGGAPCNFRNQFYLELMRKSKAPGGPVQKKPGAQLTTKQRNVLLKESMEELFTPELIEAMDRDIVNDCRVANRRVENWVADIARGQLRELDTHSKMKTAQDWTTTLFLHPSLRRQFIKQSMKNPLALAKLVVAMMPKELNVEVNNMQGVILVPMRANLDEWEKQVLADGRVIEGETLEPRVDNWEDLISKG